MRANGLLILAIVTALSVAAAFWAVFEREQSTRAAQAPDALFPGLVERVNEVAKVEVRGPGIAFTIVKDDDGNWSVPEKGGYPVKFETVKQTVVGMAALKPLEQRTAKPELHAKLNLKSPEDGGRGTLLALRDASGGEMAAVLVGKTRSFASDSRPGWHYVRKAGENQSWLAEGRVEVWDKIDRWLDSDMPTIERRRIYAVHTEKPDGEVIDIHKDDPDGRDFTVEDIPEGMRMLHETVANSLGSALGYLSFEDVLPAGEKDVSDGMLAQYRTFDGLVLGLRIKKEGDAYWAQFASRFDPDAVIVDRLAEDDRKGMKTAEDVGLEAERLQKRYGPWVFKLPEYKGKDFFISREELIMKIPEGEKTGG